MSRTVAADYSTRLVEPGLRARIIEPNAIQFSPKTSLKLDAQDQWIRSSSLTTNWGVPDEYLITFWIKLNTLAGGEAHRYFDLQQVSGNNNRIAFYKQNISGGSPRVAAYAFNGVLQFDREGPQDFDALRGRWTKWAFSAEAPNTYIWSIDNTFVFNIKTFLQFDSGRRLNINTTEGTDTIGGEINIGPIYIYNGFVSPSANSVFALMDLHKFDWNPLVAVGNYTQAAVDKLAHWIHPAAFGEFSRTRFGVGVLDETSAVLPNLTIVEDSP